VTDSRAAGHVPVVPLAASKPVAPSFEAVYAEHFAFVWRIVRRLGVADRHLDDAAQDVFVVVHRKLAGFQGRSSVRTWLYSIARRVASDYRRRSSRKESGCEPLGSHAAAGPTPLQEVETSEAVAMLHRALEHLPVAQREVFVLAELEQMTAPEIAAATGAPVNTVYSRLRLARGAFNEAVAALAEGKR